MLDITPQPARYPWDSQFNAIPIISLVQPPFSPIRRNPARANANRSLAPSTQPDSTGRDKVPNPALVRLGYSISISISITDFFPIPFTVGVAPAIAISGGLPNLLPYGNADANAITRDHQNTDSISKRNADADRDTDAISYPPTFGNTHANGNSSSYPSRGHNKSIERPSPTCGGV